MEDVGATSGRVELSRGTVVPIAKIDEDLVVDYVLSPSKIQVVGQTDREGHLCRYRVCRKVCSGWRT